MRTSRTLLGLAVVVGLLAGCGERVSPGDADGTVTVREAAASTSATPEPTATPTTTPTSTPTPAPTPPPSATTIPDGLVLDDELPADGGDFQRHRTGVSVELCGEEEVFPVGDLADRRTAMVTGPEYGEGRDLRLFADVPSAEAFLAEVRARFAACPGTEDDGGSASLIEVRASSLEADESFTGVQTYRQDDLPVLGATFWEVVRIGNAVLLTVSYGEWDPQHNLDAGIRDHAREVAPVVEAMRAFTSDPR